jgi:hypothetical protein
LPDIIVGVRSLLCGSDRCLDGVLRDGFYDLRGHSLIHTFAANADTQSRPDMTIIASALIAMRVPGTHTVKYPHHAPTPTAT